MSYLGKKFNLAGDNELEALRLNTIGMFLYDLFSGELTAGRKRIFF